MYICMCIYIPMYACIYIYILYTCMYTNLYIYTYIYILYTYVYVQDSSRGVSKQCAMHSPVLAKEYVD